MMRFSLALAAVALIACGQDSIGVSRGSNSDYNHGELMKAIDAFVSAGRTPPAFAQLSQTILALRPDMDSTVAKEAELKLIVLALGPVQANAAKPMTDQIDALALTVWPALLSPRIEADEIITKRDPHAAELLPKPDEDARTYLRRLCGGPLAGDCKQVVPEFQGAIVASLATRRATERARNAISDCVMCTAEAGWHEAVRAWEELDRIASATIHDMEREADPDNWPIAGNASEGDPGLPEAKVNETGEVIVGGQHYGPKERVEALRDLRGPSDTIALHLKPELTLAQVKALIGDARKSGATKIAVIARESHYPWERRVYWLADNAGTRAGLRPTDSLQLLLHAVDHLAGPGAIARVD